MFRVETPYYVFCVCNEFVQKVFPYKIIIYLVHFFAAGSAGSVGTEYYLLPKLREE